MEFSAGTKIKEVIIQVPQEMIKFQCFKLLAYHTTKAVTIEAILISGGSQRIAVVSGKDTRC